MAARSVVHSSNGTTGGGLVEAYNIPSASRCPLRAETIALGCMRYPDPKFDIASRSSDAAR